MEHFLKDYIETGIKQRMSWILDKELIEKIEVAAETVCSRLKAGNKVMIAGNGGSAADAQHIAAEFVSRFKFDRPGLPAIALTTDTSALTAIGNDYGFDKLFERQLQAIGVEDDIFIGISTSGKSPNIIKALEYAEKNNVHSILLTGFNEQLFPATAQVIRVPSEQTCFIQEMHITVGHYICDYIEQSIFK